LLNAGTALTFSELRLQFGFSDKPSLAEHVNLGLKLAQHRSLVTIFHSFRPKLGPCQIELADDVILVRYGLYLSRFLLEITVFSVI